jgi:endonuclease YncB( thermonuclease family)
MKFPFFCFPFSYSSKNKKNVVQETHQPKTEPLIIETTNKEDLSHQMLLTSTKQSIPPYTLNGQTLLGKVVSIYDGDTCTMNIWHPNPLHCAHCPEINYGYLRQYTIRLEGYDSPEMKPAKSIPEPQRTQLIEKAYAARNQMAEWLTGIPFYSSPSTTQEEKKDKKKMDQLIQEQNRRLITIQCHSWDKYGRLLVSIPLDQNPTLTSAHPELNPLNPGTNSLNHAMIQLGHGKAYDGGHKDAWS